MTIPVLIHHSANRDHQHPANSLRALRHCLDAGARAVEIDINAVVDGDFALLHDAELEAATNGSGYTFRTTAAQVCQLCYVHQHVVTDEPVGLLSQAVSLTHDYPSLQELQLDLKPHAALTDPVLEALLKLIEPVKSQIRVTTIADWSLRRLHKLDPDLSIGFDPLLYLDRKSQPRQERDVPPYRAGAYGYRDDHPLASRVWGTPADYLAARAEALAILVPPGTTWYIRAALLAQTLDDGFDWIAFLHSQGVQVVAWTLNASRPAQLALARRLVRAGVDRITTDDAPRLARTLNNPAAF